MTTVDRVGVHATHCCPIHGCKYNDDDCPVEAGAVKPEYGNNNGCERCEADRENLRHLADTLAPRLTKSVIDFMHYFAPGVKINERKLEDWLRADLEGK